MYQCIQCLMLEQPRHHSAPTVMKWGLAVVFCLPVFLSPSCGSYFCSFSYRCHLPLFGCCNGFHGGWWHKGLHSLHKYRGHGGKCGGAGESSHWFPLTGCWTLRAALSPWRNLSSCIYITGLDVPVWGRQPQGVLAKGKVFAAPPPLPPAGNPAAHPPVKLQQWKEKYEKKPNPLQMALRFSKLCVLGEESVF